MPATGNFVLDKGYDASAALTKFRAVKLTAAETVGPVTAITDMVIGVEQFGCTAGEIAKGKGASVRLQGITEMEAASAISVGDRVSINASGQAKTAAATGERIVGVALSAASGASTRLSVSLDLPGMIGTTGA